MPNDSSGNLHCNHPITSLPAGKDN